MASKVSEIVDAVPEADHSPSAAVISVQNLVHRYENRTALNGVSFDVRPAELFGLLGPNGSGKTTLFRILSTLMIPTAGRAIVMGYDAAKDPAPLRRQIGVVFQAQSVDLKLTAYENLWHQGHLYGLRGAALDQRVGEILVTRGPGRARQRARGDFFWRHAAANRTGQRTACTIPRCCCWMSRRQASIRGRGAICGSIFRILRDEEHVSVLVTTHLMEEAERCDRLAIMNEGNLVALGTPADLKSEIGGDVMLLEAASDAGLLAEHIRARFHVETTVLENQVRIERERGPPLCARRGRGISRRDSSDFGEQAGVGRCVYSPHRPQVLERRQREPSLRWARIRAKRKTRGGSLRMMLVLSLVLGVIPLLRSGVDFCQRHDHLGAAIGHGRRACS